MGREIKRVPADFRWPDDDRLQWRDDGVTPIVPTGDGWQVWETVSEGSPISPVLPTREALIEWLMSPAYNWGVSRPLTREQAEAFVTAGDAFTLIMSDTGIIPGDQYVTP